MPIFLQRRRLTSLIVSIAILLNLCAPAISQAVTLLTANPLALEICSATRAAASDTAPAKLPAHTVKHCVLCAVQGGSDAPPPAPAGLLAVLEGHDVYPAPRHTARMPQSTWSDAQARGPPAAA
ncbi:DUF2946 domain-containing protein [Duganella sp. CY15W]|uniref:DUF2946 family protein n=1 Tax=Duganella sp. CY15W TaxID=2692172 RepID=UPI00136C3CDD|nr:DUF2946 family protein [Duganella sp. CY15W]MYM31149.1 DUF2946 domain-containing protein [Duganella sp. CY15W]